VTLSASTIRRRRIAHRKVLASKVKEQFAATVGSKPLTLHWDGKLLPDVTQWKTKVDRIAILVTGQSTEQLLGVIKIQQGTGFEMARVCSEAIDNWNIRENIKSLCFDTTASNTGLIRGASTQLEKKLGRELLWFACRHHMYEVVLGGVFENQLGKTSAPHNLMFSRFQSQWQTINKSKFSTIDADKYLTARLNSQPELE